MKNAPQLAAALFQSPPISALRIMSEGFHKVSSIQNLGSAWRSTLRKADSAPSQPAKILNQLKKAADNNELSVQAQKDLRLLRAVAELDFSLRTAINTLRALLSKSGNMEYVQLLTHVECRKAHDTLIETAKSFASLGDRRANLEKDARNFVEEVARCETPEQAATLVIQLTMDIMGASEVFALTNDRIRLRRPWAKKHAKDDSRGLLFRLANLGNLLAESRWHPDLEPLGLDDTAPVEFDSSLVIPSMWNEWPATPKPKTQQAEQQAAPSPEQPQTPVANMPFDPDREIEDTPVTDATVTKESAVSEPKSSGHDDNSEISDESETKVS